VATPLISGGHFSLSIPTSTVRSARSSASPGSPTGSCPPARAREHQDVEEFGARSGAEGVDAGS